MTPAPSDERLRIFAESLSDGEWTSALLKAYNPTGDASVTYEQAKAALVSDLDRRSITTRASEGEPRISMEDAHKALRMQVPNEPTGPHADLLGQLEGVWRNMYREDIGEGARGLIAQAMNALAAPNQSKRVERLEAGEDDNSDILKEVSENFRADLDRIMADNHPPETGWLCEWRHANGPEWWTLGGDDGGYFAKDSIKALRFARKEDAQAYIDEAGWTEIVPTEHEWGDYARQALGDRS